jgi:DNA-binding response OmpR family regulator
MRIGSDLIVQPAPCLFAPMSARMPPSASSAAGEGNLSLRGRRILIVEDESLIAMLIGDAVEEAGGEVVGPCYTVAECMKAAQVEEIDAAVLDVDLAGRDVFPAADELRKREIPFLFHTAHADRQELSAQFGDVPLCRKPVAMNELVAVLARIAGPSPTS